MRHPRLISILTALALVLSIYWHSQNSRPLLNSNSAQFNALIHQIAAESVYGTRGWVNGIYSAQCNDLSQFAKAQLLAFGFQARIVALMTLEAHDGGDDGHTLLEAFNPASRRWEVYDFSADRHYPETIIEFVHRRVAYEKLSDQPMDPVYSDPYGVFSHTERWYDRVAQVALIQADDGHFYDADPRALFNPVDAYVYDAALVRDLYSGE